MFNLLHDLENCSSAIAAYLAEEQLEDGSFPARSFYGETFCVLLWSYWPERYKDNITKALLRYWTNDKTDPEFHWEFNNFALLKYYDRNRDERVRPYITQLKFKGTPVTNWTLLRAVCRFMAKNKKLQGWAEILNKVLKFQKRGFILDNYGVKSFSYHCFSAALLAEIHELTRNCWIRRRFLKAVEFISSFIMPSGDTLYIGRGQQQVFGYGCLIFILAYSFALTRRKEYIYQLHKIFNFVSTFQRKDGSSPLVLRNDEKGFPEVIDTRDPNYCGWYAYNNFFDYLPFFAYWLVRTSDLLKNMKISPDLTFQTQNHERVIYRDKDFFVFANENYQAVISAPGGYWANDMPIPYVCFRGHSVTPCYGGEQFANSIYSREGIPLPFGKLSGQMYFFRDELDYKLEDSVLMGKNENIRHERRFKFLEKAIVVKDYIKLLNCPFDELYYINLLLPCPVYETNSGIFWEKDNIRIKISLPEDTMITNHSYYSASGELKALRNSEKPKKNSIYTEIVMEMQGLQ